MASLPPAGTGAPGIATIGVGVGGMILGDDGRVLLARRGPLARNRRGEWENPGGALAWGEDFEDAIRREIREELAIEVVVEGLLRVVNHIMPAAGDVPMQHWVSPTLVCRHTGGEPRICEPGKCDDIGWFAMDALPDPMAVISRADLDCYRHLVAAGGRLLPVDWCHSGARPEMRD